MQYFRGECVGCQNVPYYGGMCWVTCTTSGVSVLGVRACSTVRVSEHLGCTEHQHPPWRQRLGWNGGRVCLSSRGRACDCVSQLAAQDQRERHSGRGRSGASEVSH
jgi:hypothetical protein